MKNKASSWLEYRAEKTGKTVEELREEMRQRSLKADRSTSGFASMSVERRRELQRKSVEARKENKGDEKH